MELQEFAKYEVVGLANTINEYTRDHYIKNYTRLLVEYSLQEEYVQLKPVIKRLLEWYETIIEDIRTDKYLYNIKQHEKSLLLLKNIYNIIIEK